jgi:hypothetical protein
MDFCVSSSDWAEQDAKRVYAFDAAVVYDSHHIEWGMYYHDPKHTGRHDQPAAGTISSNVAWYGNYTLWGDVTVGDGATLRIEAGTRIEVRDGLEIAVNPAGQLIIEGEEGNPVVITSASSNPTPGIWNGIWLNDGANLTAEYCVIEDANNGIYAKPNTQVNAAHCTFKNCLNSGFYGSGVSSSHSISGSTFQDCGNYGALFYGGNPVFDYNSVTGCKYGIKYLGDGTVYIRNNVMDASGMSAQSYWGIYVGPSLSTDTPTPIINGDSITFFDQGGIYVANSYASGALNGSIRSKHNTIYGLYLKDSSPSLSCLGDATHNTFSYSTYGIYCTKQCNSVFHWNKVVKNTFGVFIDRAATPDFGNVQSQGNNKIEKDALGVYEMKSDNTSYTVPARGNWWGMDGPQVIGNIDAGGALTTDPMNGYERREAPGASVLPKSIAASSFPNPFNASAEIRFSLPEQTQVSVAIYDISGRLVKELVSGEYPAGEHAVVWHGTNAYGVRVTSGVYLYSLSTSSERRVLGKMVLLK